MGLDVRLEDPYGDEVYWANITHNLTRMASAAGIYDVLWRPDEIGITRAKDIVKTLAAGTALLESDQARFEQLNAPNGWGVFEDFLPWCMRYLQACRDNPEAFVRVSR